MQLLLNTEINVIERTNSEARTSKNYQQRSYKILKKILVDLESRAI